ncbi:hypothetical protein BDZ97DRAFT_1811104 [Flammula alnicola]|nr:hypothetical protein BDZ97DRAFT_1811104 [Flammula alnicola]
MSFHALCMLASSRTRLLNCALVSPSPRCGSIFRSRRRAEYARGNAVKPIIRRIKADRTYKSNGRVESTPGYNVFVLNVDVPWTLPVYTVWAE